MTIRLAPQQMLARALRRLFCNPIQALQIEQHQQIHTLRRAKNFPHYSDKDPRVAEPQYWAIAFNMRTPPIEDLGNPRGQVIFRLEILVGK